MASYYIQVNERIPLGRSLLAYLQSIPQIVSFEKPIEKQAHQNKLYQSLDSAFADVRLMMDGKKKKKTLDELLDELPNTND